MGENSPKENELKCSLRTADFTSLIRNIPQKVVVGQIRLC